MDHSKIIDTFETYHPTATDLRPARMSGRQNPRNMYPLLIQMPVVGRWPEVVQT